MYSYTGDFKKRKEGKMDKLWAPWRMKYVQAIDKDNDGCIFCTKPEETNDRDNLILYKGEKCFVIMNLYPYNNGHLMIVPYIHTSDINDLDSDTILEMWKLINKSVEILKNLFRAEGFNIGINLGRTAGAGIDQHVHMHIVPRWNGDTNFMPAIGETKVISQGLHDAYDMLVELFNEIGDNS